MSGNRYELFNGFSALSEKVRQLGGIIQKQPELSEEELTEWIDLFNSCMGDLNHLKEDVVRCYSDVM